MLTLNAEEVDGEKERTRTPSTLLRMMGECNEAGCGPNSPVTRLKIMKSRGTALQRVYSAFGRPLSDRYCYKQGAHHTKAFSVGKFLVVGSTNWTVSSEANQELSVLMYIEQGGADLRAQAIADLKWMAFSTTFREMQETVERMGVSFLSVQERNMIGRFGDPTANRDRRRDPELWEQRG